jgi:polyisoprenoid-binding protein YceI
MYKMTKKMYLNSVIFLFGALISFTGCKSASGDKAEISEATEIGTSEGVGYIVDTQQSLINWEGNKPGTKHTGTVHLSDGIVYINKGKVSGGEFNMDMRSITVTDLTGNRKDNLEAHLRGTNEEKAEDFFNTRVYPTAKFQISKITNLVGDDNANSMVYGNLTIKDIVKEVGFKANITVSENSVTVKTPPFTIDRTLWDIKFLSNKFFDNLADKAIDDNMGLRINLVAHNVQS